jgi:multisubunit Na+/H+ antiporter MnhE subunit
MNIALPALCSLWALSFLSRLYFVDRSDIIGESLIFLMILYIPMFLTGIIHSLFQKSPARTISIYTSIYMAAFAAMWLIIQAKFRYPIQDNLVGLVSGLLFALLFALFIVGIPSYIVQWLRQRNDA